MNIIVHVGGWDWGWDSLVAIGTLTLAFATGYLALKTKLLADQTADEVASQTRPVLVPAQRADGPRVPLIFNTRNLELEVQIRNSGRGPALDVQATLDGLAPQTWHKAAISPNTSERLTFESVPLLQEGEAAKTLSLQYRDLAGREFESRILIDRISEDPDVHYSDQYRFADVSLTSPGEIALDAQHNS